MTDSPQGRGDLSAKAEAFLFVEGGPLSLKRLRALLGCSEEELAHALAELRRKLADSGLTLVQTSTEVALSTAPSVGGLLKKTFEEALGREIGEAGLEVLAIVLYEGPSTRARIDYIRGVNTSSTIRTLLSRGLLERVGNPEDAREYLYRPTAELLAHLGVTRVDELPEYATICAELAAFEQAREPFGEPSDVRPDITPQDD